MSEIALQEPAILHLIFLKLKQLDLLRCESVCRTWHTTITSNNDLLTLLFLRPVPPEIPKLGRNSYRTNQISSNGPNLLLRKAFPLFFDYRLNRNCFARGGSNVGPWNSLVTTNGKFDRRKRRRYMHPEASWRKMLPWHRNIASFRVQFVTSTYPDKTAHMKFEQNSRETYETTETINPSSHAPWLTFGMIYDLCEAAWFQGKPYQVNSLHLEIPGCEPPLGKCGFMRNLWHPGEINLRFMIETRAKGEQHQKRIKGYCLESAKRLVGHHGKFEPLEGKGVRSRVFTNEFLFEGGLSFYDMKWDEIDENPPNPYRSAR